MTFPQFMAAVELPTKFNPALRALWLAHQGDWAAAHALVQTGVSRDDAWVHAHLHRQEGDAANAEYWYARAGRAPGQGDLQVEWERIARELLAHAP